MANGKITLGKQSGGTLGLVFPDGVSNTEVVLPESGNITSVNTAVTDNSIARYDGTTGKLQNSGVYVDDSGNLLLTSGTGALGYGAGAGGTVTQLTSKSTAVILNKPSGVIITSASNLEPSQAIQFVVRNSLVQDRTTNIIVSIYNSVNSLMYDVSAANTGTGNFFVNLTNKSNVSLAEVLQIKFDLIQGAVS